MAHHDCDKDEYGGPGCKNLIYELTLFYVEKEKKIVAAEKLIKDNEAARGQIWSLDYSHKQKRLLYTDVNVDLMR